MSVTEIIAGQVTDPFRIVLLIGLVITMMRTRAATGVALPLALGGVFVAFLLPMTSTDALVPVAARVGWGLVSNTLILGVVLGVWTLIARSRG